MSKIDLRLNDTPWLAPCDGTFSLESMPTRADEADAPISKKALRKVVRRIADAQRMLYAQNRFAVLLVFQAMDAAGKDSTIRNVLSGVNPAGCQVWSFKRPSSLELDHDFLWRTTLRLPERGRIGVFNRSQYEEVLVVRVHPSILDNQQLPIEPDLNTIWDDRLSSIAQQEAHLARNGTIVLKFFLNVSRDEQKRRFLDRLNRPEKRWKFEPNDVRERHHWEAYMSAYQQAIAATSKPWAPWYCIPADNKPRMRMEVAQIISRTLDALPLEFPQTGAADQAVHDEMHAQLLAEDQP
ncbi:MAG: PPK2 family polyphosphate kinase [Pseudomonadota bacterium]